MLASRTPLVRPEALGALNRLGEFEAVEASLWDSSSLVRGTARFYLKPRSFDVLGARRQMPGADGDLVTPGVVAGLTPSIDIDDMLALIVDDPSVAVIRQATEANHSESHRTVGAPDVRPRRFRWLRR